MGVITCTRRVQFAYGHRLVGHESKCAHVHGHNGVALFEAEAEQLDAVGRVVDFSVLKDRLGGWVDEHWDHGFLANRADEEMVAFLEVNGQKFYELPYNPTAENMARYLGEVVAPAVMAGTGVRVVAVKLWETENCCAEWRRGGGVE